MFSLVFPLFQLLNSFKLGGHDIGVIWGEYNDLAVIAYLNAL